MTACYIMATDDEDARAECRRYPPQMFVFEGEVFNGFPNAEDRCGEYKRDESLRPSTDEFYTIHYQPQNVWMTGGKGYVIETAAPLQPEDYDEIIRLYVAGWRYIFYGPDKVRARIRKEDDVWATENLNTGKLK